MFESLIAMYIKYVKLAVKKSNLKCLGIAFSTWKLLKNSEIS